MERSFDVFLSHNSKDKPAVVELAEAMKDRGLRPWLDQWELVPGRPWQEALEAVIETVPSAAILVGRDGLGPWEEVEMRACLAEFVKRDLPVIPVLLPDAPEAPKLPMFLRGFTWVDLRGDPCPGLDRLMWGITGEKPLPETQEREIAPPRPPALHNLPLTSLDGLFKGRTQLLTQLAADLELNPAAAIVQPEVIHGLGGIGKTRLALEYAWRSGDRYSAAFFVQASTPESLGRGLSSLAGPRTLDLKMEGYPEQYVIETILSWLGSHSGWLMILDNVDTEDAALAVRNLLPSLANGHVLVTCRIARWAPGVRKRSVGKLSPADARIYLLERTDAERRHLADDEQLARELAELLDGLPLALEQAAAYIAARGLSFAQYLRSWDNESTAVMSWYDKAEMSYPSSLAVTWQQSFDQLGPEARVVLRLLSHLAPDPIAADILNEENPICDAAKLYADESGQEVDIDVGLAVAELVKYSFVSRDGEKLSVHRMVQEVVRERIPQVRRSSWIRQATVMVLGFSPEDPEDVRTWPVWDSLRPHATRVIELAEGAHVETDSGLMNQLATLLYCKSLYNQAEPLMRRALEVDESSLGNEHPNVARDLNNLATLLKATNRLLEAEPLMRRALEIDESSLGNEHPNVARDLNNLATLLKATNRLLEAEPLMRRALEIDEKSLGEEHPKVARDLSNLATLLKATNRLSEAEPLMRRALGIDESSFGDEHPNVARDLNNLATLLKATNRFLEAEPLMRRALEIDESSFGDEHPNVARDLNNLAQLLKATNRLSEAEPLMRRALEIDESSFGDEHPNVAIHLNNLAQLLKATNRLSEAEPLMRRALEIDESSFGEEHPKVAIDLNNLAQVLRATNRLSEAEPLMRRALGIDESSFGDEHPKVAIRLNNLAQVLHATNRLSEAEPLMRRALEIDESSFGDEHPKVAIRLNNLAQLLQATNHLPEAEPLMRRALEIDKRSFGEEHPKVAIRLNNLAQLLQATNRLSEAEPLMRRALEIDESSFGDEHPKIAIRLNNLAQLLQATNRLPEAEPLMRRALEIDKRSFGDEHPDVAIDLNNLAQLLQATNRSAEAELLMRRALKIFATSLGENHPSTTSVQRNLDSLLTKETSLIGRVRRWAFG